MSMVYALPVWLEDFQVILEEPSPRIPILLLDAFLLERVGASAITMVVVGCIEGELRLIPESHLHTLPKVLLEQWQKIQTRVLRTVKATDFALCVMDAFDVSSRGLTAWLRAMLHIRVEADTVLLEPLEHRGEIRVSAGSAVASVRHSQTCAFDNPRADGEITHHWWLPLGTPLEVQAGQGLLLVYTMPDPAIFDGSDNRVVQQRLQAGLSVSSKDDLSEALNAFMRGETRVVVPIAPVLQPMPKAPIAKTIKIQPKPVQPVVIASPATKPTQASYTKSSPKRWDSDFAYVPPKKRATQSNWWRDFAPTAIGINDIYTPSDFSSDFD
jgi:hypothetical protein